MYLNICLNWPHSFHFITVRYMAEYVILHYCAQTHISNSLLEKPVVTAYCLCTALSMPVLDGRRQPRSSKANCLLNSKQLLLFAFAMQIIFSLFVVYCDILSNHAPDYVFVFCPWCISKYCDILSGYVSYLANTTGTPSVGLMLGQRRRRWANIEPIQG